MKTELLWSGIWFPDASIPITFTNAWVVGVSGTDHEYEVLVPGTLVATGSQDVPLFIEYWIVKFAAVRLLVLQRYRVSCVDIPVLTTVR